MNIPVFVINLKQSIERREHTSRQLNDLAIPFQLIEAVDGTNYLNKVTYSIPDNIEWKCGIKSRFLLKGEIGCILSHMHIYNKIIRENIEVACILEDDNDYCTDFKKILSCVNINNVDWDILLLGHHSGILLKGTRCRIIKSLTINGYYLGKHLEHPFGTYAYLIKKKAAQALLKYCLPIRMPADLYTANAKKLGLNTIIISPPCAFNSQHFNSTINQVNEIVYTKPIYTLFRKHFVQKLRPILVRNTELFRLYSWIRYNKSLPLIIVRKAFFLSKSQTKKQIHG